MSFNIAIDGPAGAGKSTVARELARVLGFFYVDTGAMYRAAALSFLRKGISPDDREAVEEACRDVHVSVDYLGGEQQVFLNGENVTGLIRTEEVSQATSKVSAIGAVREMMLAPQREFAAGHDTIMDGRDIGTAVLPHAQLKVYLTASVETRAGRRYREELERFGTADYEKICESIAERDYRDMHRAIAPLSQAEDAILVDSSDQTVQESVDTILGLYWKRVCP